MDGELYLRRFAALSSAEERAALFTEAAELENEDRALFTAGEAEKNAIPQRKGLVAVFDGDAGAAQFTARRLFDEDSNRAEVMFPLEAEEKDALLEAPISVPHLSAFTQHFMQIFCVNALQFMDWTNVVAAGGAVAGCVQPIPQEYDASVLEKRKYFHDVAFNSSDIDLFLVGLTSEEEANAKLREIYDSVCSATPFEVICFRSAHAVTMVSQYPYRHVQVVLRLYSSPYEVLAGFDVDSCTFLYDGDQVYTTPRGHMALTSRCNSVDLSRRSPSYEMRLAKYASRGFEVRVPDFRRERVDPNVFDKPWGLLVGLQKLAVLEQLRTAEARLQYQTRHQTQSGMALRLHQNQRHYGQLERIEKSSGGGDSSYATVFLPWGKDFSARRVLKLMKKKDVVLNSGWFKKDRTHFIHPCFFGTADEVIRDCAPDDPPLPSDLPEDALRNYVRGPIKWMRDDPGRQQIGSFNPLSPADWAQGVYFLEATDEVCRAVNANDVVALAGLLDDLGDEWDPFQRDYLGRSPLHIGLLSGADDAVKLLLEADAVDPTLRMPDGRSALHLAAMYDRPRVMAPLRAAIMRAEKLRAVYMSKSEAARFELRERGEPVPREISLRDATEVKTFDRKLTPLQVAVIMGRVDVAEALLRDFGASATELVGASRPGLFHGRVHGAIGEALVPLVVLVPPNRDEGDSTMQQLVALLMEHGGGTYEALLLPNLSTALHVCAHFGNAPLLRCIMRELEARGGHDTLQRLLATVDESLGLPIYSAVAQGSLECAQILWDKLPRLAPDEETIARLRMTVGKLLSGSANNKGAPVDWQRMQLLQALQAAQLVSAPSALLAACDGLLLCWKDLLDPAGPAPVFSNAHRFGFRGNWHHGTKPLDLRPESARAGIFASEEGDEELDKDVDAQRRRRVNDMVAVLEWLLPRARELGAMDAKIAPPISVGGMNLDPDQNPYYFSYHRQNQPVDESTLVTVAEALRKVRATAAPHTEDADAETRSVEDQAYAGLVREMASEDAAVSYDAAVFSMALRNRAAALLAQGPQQDAAKQRQIAESIVARLDLLIGALNDSAPAALAAEQLESARRSSASRQSAGRQSAGRQSTGSSARSSARLSSLLPRRSTRVRNFLRGLGTGAKRESVQRLAEFLKAGSADVSAEEAAEEEVSVRATAAALKLDAAQMQAKAAGGVTLKFISTAAAAVEDGPAKPTVESVTRRIRNALFGKFAVHTLNGAAGYYFNPAPRGAALGDADQERALQLFRAAFRGDVDAVRAALAPGSALGFPPLSVVDALGNTLIALVASRARDPGSVVAVLLQHAQDSFEETPDAPKRKSGGRARRVDNLKLLDAEFGEDDGSESDEEAAEEAAEDDDDEHEDKDDPERAEAFALSDDLDQDAMRGRAKKTLFSAVSALASDATASRVPVGALLAMPVVLDWAHVAELVPERLRAELDVARAAQMRAKQPPAASLAVPLLGVAALRNDPELFRVLVRSAARIADKRYVLGNLADSWNGRLVPLLVALDRHALLRIYAEEAGGGAVWPDVAARIGCLKPLQESESGNANNHARYRGMTTVLETGARRGLADAGDGGEEQGAVDEEVEPLKATWHELACALGATETLRWLQEDPGDAASAFDTFLARAGAAASGERAVARAAARLGGVAGMALGRLRKGKLSQLEDSDATTPGAMLAALVATRGEVGVAQLNSAGVSLLGYAVSGKRLDVVRGLASSAGPRAIDAVCEASNGFGLNEARMGTDEEDAEAHEPGMRPVLVAARAHDVPMFRMLVQELGGDPLVSESATHRNALHVACVKLETRRDAAYILEMIDIVRETAGPEGLMEMMTQKDVRGVTPFHMVFAQGSVDIVDKLFGALVTPELATGADAELRTPVHVLIDKLTVFESAAQDKLRYLVDKMGPAAWAKMPHREDIEGATPLDGYLKQVLDPSVNLFGDSLLVDRVYDDVSGSRKNVRRQFYGWAAQAGASYSKLTDNLSGHALYGVARHAAAAPRAAPAFEAVRAHVVRKIGASSGSKGRKVKAVRWERAHRRRRAYAVQSAAANDVPESVHFILAYFTAQTDPFTELPYYRASE